MFKKNNLSTLLFTLVIGACSTESIGKNAPIVTSSDIHPGEARFITFPKSNFSTSAKLVCRDTSYKFYEDGQNYSAYIAESYFSDRTSFDCVLKEGEKQTVVASFKVNSKKFPEEKLRVAARKIKPKKKDQIRIAKEQEQLNQIYASSVAVPYFKTSFMAPLNSFVTSIYGIKRTYNKEHKGQHLGTDFRAAIGDKVPASNRGKIVYAGDLFFTGWTVIIDHGLDIFTVYGHLSKTLVEAGQIVQKGDLIGLSGNTGRTSGPHLHWGVKVHGQYIDGMDLSEQTKKQFSE